MAKRQYGTGSVARLKTKDKKTGEITESRYFYIFYHAHGRLIRESARTESVMEAEGLLKRRMGEAGLGIKPQQDVKNVRYEEVRDALVAEYKNQGRASVFTHKDGTEYIGGLNHLDDFFKGMRVTDITTDTLRRYIESRRKAGAADPTIRRQLVLLRSMLNQARKEGRLRLADIPHFPMPPDSKPRKGFVNPDVFVQLRAAMPENLRPLITFLYYTGCRTGAAKKITWDMVSKDCQEIELPGEITKNGEPLTLPLVGIGLKEVSVMLKKMFRKEGSVFDSTNFRKEWATACHKLGLGVKDGWRYHGLTPHDFRRSAARNLRRAGVTEDVAMSVTGHKSRTVFSRYNITDTADIHEALVKVGQYAKIQERKAGKR
ncbi:MAG TPA: tyrosine-type recombinase/integrase [Candidatus Acidoferrales bacterium]|nr:tyrosine-type recombinase/integrase [Candidatus Acidoferrales bacterium]